MRPGETLVVEGEIELNVGRAAVSIVVVNRGDRPVQVGSRYHFFEVNVSLEFDREQARRCRLTIPAGSSVRFEPGEPKTVSLVAFGGEARVLGFRRLLEG